jgi:DNA-binding NarL/FixJ family response regulator
MDRKIRILLVDDHAMVRQDTRELLERQDDLEVIGEAGDGAEAIDLAGQLMPDVILMDVRMPGMSGIEATRRIKVQQPEIAILALSAYDDAQYVAAAKEAGAAGYLLKNARGSELVAAIRAVHTRGSPPAQ